MPSEKAHPEAGTGFWEEAKRSLFTVFLVFACLALAVLVLLLAKQNRELKQALSATGREATPANALKAGDVVAPFGVVASSGERSTVEFGGDGRRTVLLVFSMQCPACEKTLPVWTDLFAAGTSSTTRVLGLRLDKPTGGSDPSGLLEGSLPFPLYVLDSPEPPELGRIPFIPATILLDASGGVRKTWYGMLDQEQVDELRRELGA